MLVDPQILMLVQLECVPDDETDGLKTLLKKSTWPQRPRAGQLVPNGRGSKEEEEGNLV